MELTQKLFPLIRPDVLLATIGLVNQFGSTLQIRRAAGASAAGRALIMMPAQPTQTHLACLLAINLLVWIILSFPHSPRLPPLQPRQYLRRPLLRLRQ